MYIKKKVEWIFQDNNYYHPSLGTGYMLNDVIQVNRIFDNGDGSFLVEGGVYRFESSMESNLYEQYSQPKSMWSASMESELIGTVTTTIVYSEKLNHCVLEDYQANYFSDNEWVASESINNGLWIFTSDKAIQYAEYYYGIDEDILCLIYETAYYDEFGEMYYVLRLKSKSLANFEGSEILLVARVYEDGKMLASGEKEELRVQKETVFNGDQSAEVKEVIEYYFGAEQLESIVSLDDFDSKLVYSVSLYSQIGDIMDTSYLAEQFSALGLEYDVEMYL